MTKRPPLPGVTTQMQFSTISFVERPADCSRQRLVWGHTIRREVACGLLGHDLDLRIRRDKLVRDGNALYDLDALTNEGVAFHITHRNEPINSPQAKPMDHVRHELLEPGVLYSGHAFRALKIGRRGIATLLALARIVNKELRDLAKRAALLAVIDDHAKPARLRRSRTFFDPVDQIRPTGTDVGAKDVRPVALVMHTASDLCARIVQFLNLAKEINCRSPNWRQKDLHIGARHQLGKHPRGLFEEGAAQIGFYRVEACGNAGEVPHRIYGDLDDRDAPILMHHTSVRVQPPSRQGNTDFREVKASAGDCNARTKVETIGYLRLEGLRDQMSPGIHGHNAAWLHPLRKRADLCSWVCICQIRPPDRIERTRGYCKRSVERVRPPVTANDVAVLRPRNRADDRATLARARRPPMNRKANFGVRVRM